MPKIIQTDNFAREYIPEKLVCENIDNYYGQIVIDFLNGKFDNSDLFFKLEQDDYKPITYEDIYA